jgi:hypothetical protein
MQDHVQKDLKVDKIPVYHVFVTDEKGISTVQAFATTARTKMDTTRR